MVLSLESVRGPELPLCPFVLPNAVRGAVFGRLVVDDPTSCALVCVSGPLLDSLGDGPGSTNGSTVYGVSDGCLENAEVGDRPGCETVPPVTTCPSSSYCGCPSSDMENRGMDVNFVLKGFMP